MAQSWNREHKEFLEEKATCRLHRKSPNEPLVDGRVTIFWSLAVGQNLPGISDLVMLYKRVRVPGVISIENCHIKIENTTCTSLSAWTLKHAFNWGREPDCSTILHVNMYCETALSLKSLKGH